MKTLRLARWTPVVALVIAPALVPGCSDGGGEARGPSPEALGKVDAALTKAERLARYEKIKAAAATRGISSTAYLLAGIAYAETGLAHCWSDSSNRTRRSTPAPSRK